MNLQAVRVGSVVLVIVLLYGSRMTKGSSRQSSDGLVFGMKPFVIISRVLALVVYLGYFANSMRTSQFTLPAWFPVVILVAILFSVLQLPGTIVLGPDALTQKFWLLGTKRIPYNEVSAIQKLNAGQAVRVAGNRVAITHTNNQSASEEFVAELEQRTGKRAS